jgi:hypothetical protein
LKDFLPYIPIIAAVVAIAGLLIGRAERRRTRINGFVERYVAAIRAEPNANPMKPLKLCGVLGLRDDAEIQSAFSTIEQRGHRNPKNSLPTGLREADLHLVFRTADKHGFDISEWGGLVMFIASEVCPVAYQPEDAGQEASNPKDHEI